MSDFRPPKPSPEAQALGEVIGAESRRLAGMIANNRERYVAAWLAATDIPIEEACLVERHGSDGSVTITVERRDTDADREFRRELERRIDDCRSELEAHSGERLFVGNAHDAARLGANLIEERSTVGSRRLAVGQ